MSQARHRRPEDQLVRRFYVLTAVSTLVPGLGLIPSRRRTGWVILGTFVLGLLGVVGYALVKGVTSSILQVGVSRDALAVTVPLFVIGALAWIYGIVMTARDNLPSQVRGPRRAGMLAAASLAVLLVALPAAQATRYSVIQRGLIADVFASIRPDGAVAPGDGEDPWAATDRVTIMLVGSDAGPDRTGVRPDRDGPPQQLGTTVVGPAWLTEARGARSPRRRRAPPVRPAPPRVPARSAR